MGQIAPAAVIACVLVASLSRLAEAQTITGSFDELSRFLRSGDLVQVTDGSGAVTWGRVTELSDASLILNEMEKAPDRAAALTTGRRRVFSENDITTIVRSDVSGRAGEPIYSTSWHRVQMLAPGTDVGIVLKNGERQSFRLSKAGSDVLHLSTTDGREETVAKSEIRADQPPPRQRLHEQRPGDRRPDRSRNDVRDHGDDVRKVRRGVRCARRGADVCNVGGIWRRRRCRGRVAHRQDAQGYGAGLPRSTAATHDRPHANRHAARTRPPRRDRLLSLVQSVHRASTGIEVRTWFVGLSSPELHIARVRSRVARGGHDIPEEKIRERYDHSRVNLIELMPTITELRVYDNSIDADPHAGHLPRPVLILHLAKRKIVQMVDLDKTPD